ncbi:hypothetical protein COCVIDRAFT_19195 [Bipolaris victoriae FI3]|uniref:Uncharacterized protein n=1 Tax=Bipolaris victoriae (strain FI3) TaxID=930091 RepID=W7DYT3_BIPV3|nr:hypothetical protein COCVIDRAFT_19195 [Bipolaris victoriae FI3]
MAEAGPFVVTVAQAVVLARCPLYRHEVPHVPLHMLPNRPLRRAQANSATRQDSQHATHAYAVLYATLPYATLPYPALYTNYSAASAAKQIDVATPRRPCCSHAALSGPSSSTFLFPPPITPITPIHAPFLHTRASPLHPSVAAHAPLPASSRRLRLHHCHTLLAPCLSCRGPSRRSPVTVTPRPFIPAVSILGPLKKPSSKARIACVSLQNHATAPGARSPIRCQSRASAPLGISPSTLSRPQTFTRPCFLDRHPSAHSSRPSGADEIQYPCHPEVTRPKAKPASINPALVSRPTPTWVVARPSC